MQRNCGGWWLFLRYTRWILLHVIVLHHHGAVRADDLVRAFLEWRNHFIAGLFEYIIYKRMFASLAASTVRYNLSICLIQVLLPSQTFTKFLQSHILAPALPSTRDENAMFSVNALRLTVWWIYRNPTSVSRTVTVALEHNVWTLRLLRNMLGMIEIVIAWNDHRRFNLIIWFVYRGARIRILFLLFQVSLILTSGNLHTVALITWFILGDWWGLLWRIWLF